MFALKRLSTAMRAAPLAACTAAIAIATAFAPSRAQAQPAGAETAAPLAVSRFDPASVELSAADQAFVLVHGTALAALTEARVLEGGDAAPGILANLGSFDAAQPGVRILRLSAKPDAKPGSYRVQLRAGRGIVATPAPLELTVTASADAARVVDVRMNEPAIAGEPLRIRVRATANDGLGSIEALHEGVATRGAPDPRDPTIVEFALTFSRAGDQTLALTPIDRFGQRGPTWTRTVSVVSAMADLHLSELEVRPEFPFAGQSVGAYVTIENRGTGTVRLPAGTRLIEWTAGGDEARDFGLAGELEIGHGRARVFGPLIFQLDVAGRHLLRIRLDPDELIEESDEENNEVIRHVEVGPRRYPDLTISRVAFEPAQPSITAPITAVVTVANQGSAPATIFPPDLIVSARDFGEIRVGGEAAVFPPGETRTFRLALPPESVEVGPRQWFFNVDPDGRIEESVETNNRYMAAVEITERPPPKPDLRLISATVEPDPAKAGTAIHMLLTVQNVGAATADIPAGFTYYRIDGPMGAVIPIVTQTAERLAPGQTRGLRTVDFKLDAAGPAELSFTLDPDGLVDESDEANNLSLETILIAE